MSSLERILKAYEQAGSILPSQYQCLSSSDDGQYLRDLCELCLHGGKTSRPGPSGQSPRPMHGPPVFRLSARAEWWSQTESNRRHPACKAGALPTELWPHFQSETVCNAQENCRSLSLASAQATNHRVVRVSATSKAGRPGQTRTADLTLIRRTL